MPVRIVSAGGGGVTLSAASTGSEFTATLPANTGTVVTTASSAAVTPAMLTQPMTLATAQASTSGTSIDFTGIPSWVRRITVMFNNVSTNGNNSILVQLGTSSGVVSSGYTATSGRLASAATIVSNSTAGKIIYYAVASENFSGHLVATVVSGNTWISSHVGKLATTLVCHGGGDVALPGTLDRVRITTVGGTDTFDAGSINILYEG